MNKTYELWHPEHEHCIGQSLVRSEVVDTINKYLNHHVGYSVGDFTVTISETVSGEEFLNDR